MALNLPIVVVSGLPRSGTSMTMKMLEAGGLPILTDRLRAADEDNPEGYFELERVKQLRQDATWLAEARGKAVKIVSFHLGELPHKYPYKVLFIRRALPEVLASQRQMLARARRSGGAADESQLADLYERHLREVYAWLARQHHIGVLFLEHRATLEHPLDTAKAIGAFLGGEMDPEAMANAVNPALYRQKNP